MADPPSSVASSSRPPSPTSPGASATGQQRLPAQCQRKKFQRPPPFCPPRKPRTVLRHRAPQGRGVSPSPSPAEHTRAPTPQTAPSATPTAANEAMGASGPPPASTPAAVGGWARLPSLSPGDAAMDGRTVLAILAALLASGFIVRTWHRRYRYRLAAPSPPAASSASSSAAKKAKDAKQLAIDHIRRAQEAASSSSSSGAAPAAPSDPPTRRSRARTNSLLPQSPLAAKAAELLPSPACVKSTSAAFLDGLAQAVGIKAGSGGAQGKGKERAKDDVEDEAEEKQSVVSSGASTSVAGASAAAEGSGSSRRKEKKKNGGGPGKGAPGLPRRATLGAGDAESSAAPSIASSSVSRSPARRPSLKEAGVNATRAMSERAVQTSRPSSPIGSSVKGKELAVEPEVESEDVNEEERREEEDEVQELQPLTLSHVESDQAPYTPTPRHHSPIHESHPDLPLAEPSAALPPNPPSSSPSPPSSAAPSLPSSPSHTPAAQPLPLAAPAPRPPVLPHPFDLHASFQATPPSEPIEQRVPSSCASSASSSSYPVPSSPPLSPTPSSCSPSVSTSSTSPTSSSPAVFASSAFAISVTSSSAGKGSGHLAPAAAARDASASPAHSAGASTSSSRSRKQARKQSVATSNAAIPGMPRLPSSSLSPSPAGADKAESMPMSPPNGKQRPVPISVPSSGDGEGGRSRPAVSRRLSTASSSSGGGGGPSILMTPSEGGMRRSSARRGKGQGKSGDEGEWNGRATQRPSGGGGLKGLGVDIEGEDLDDGRSVASSAGAGRGASSSPRPQRSREASGFFPRTDLTSPESSPHPSNRSLAGSYGLNAGSGAVAQMGSTLATPTSQRPWSPELMAQQYTMIPYPASSSAAQASRPPSRGASLSVPPSLTQSQQQQVALAQQQQQQQQQQAYAYAHAQAQAQAQYQHAIAMQLQAQAQAQAQAQHEHHQRIERSRRRTLTGDGDSDGSASQQQQPNGLVYPLSSSTSAAAAPNAASWTATAASHPASPLAPSFNHHHLAAQQLAIAAAGPSPTNANFPPQGLQHVPAALSSIQPGAAGMFPGYLASPVSASPTAAFAVQSPPMYGSPRPPRPRLSSSVSSVAALGSSTSGGGGGGGGKTSKSSSTSTAKPDRPQRSLSSSVPPSSPASGNVPLSLPPDSPAMIKARMKAVEAEKEGLGRQLEIAEWQLQMMEHEKRVMEAENQDSLRALAERAARAEERVKLLEQMQAASRQAQAARREDGVEATAVPAVNGYTSPQEQGYPDESSHPLSWIDLDTISFTAPRPVHNARSSHIYLGSPTPNGSPAGKKHRPSLNGLGPNQRHSKSGRRYSRGNANAPWQPPPPPAPVEYISSDDELVIVLDAPRRRNSHNPGAGRQQPPSRRSSYLGDDDSLDASHSREHHPNGADGASFYGDDEIPSIDIDDAEPIAGGAVVGESEDGTRLHREYIGFLPTFLSPGRASVSAGASSSSASGYSPRWVPEPEQEQGVPSFLLDVPSTEEPLNEEDQDDEVADGVEDEAVDPLAVPLPSSSSEDEGDAFTDPACADGDETLPTPTEDATLVLPAPVPLVLNGTSPSPRPSAHLATPIDSATSEDEGTPRVKPPPSPPSPAPDFAAESEQEQPTSPRPSSASTTPFGTPVKTPLAHPDEDDRRSLATPPSPSRVVSASA